MNGLFSAKAAVAATFVLAAGAAQSATFNIVGGSPYTLPGPSEADATDGYGLGDLTGAEGLDAGSEVWLGAALELTDWGFVTFSYIGTQAIFDNYFSALGDQLFHNQSVSNPSVTLTFGPGLMDLAFSTSGGNNQERAPAGTVSNGDVFTNLPLSMAFFEIGAFGTSVYALFNDSWPGDADFDDMVVRIDVAPIPVPAALPLLGGGLALLGLLGWRRKRAEQAEG